VSPRARREVPEEGLGAEDDRDLDDLEEDSEDVDEAQLIGMLKCFADDDIDDSR
jgi:hypothetical protein